MRFARTHHILQLRVNWNRYAQIVPRVADIRQTTLINDSSMNEKTQNSIKEFDLAPGKPAQDHRRNWIDEE